MYGQINWDLRRGLGADVGIPANIIASGSDDHTVRVWAQDGADEEWTFRVMHTFRSPVYRISWSLTGSVRSVAANDDEVTVWK